MICKNENLLGLFMVPFPIFEEILVNPALDIITIIVTIREPYQNGLGGFEWGGQTGIIGLYCTKHI
jgi:hypothetical protein